MVEVYAPGEHWEVEFMRDGSLEIERFRSPGEIYDDEALAELWRLFAPPRSRKNSPKKRSRRVK
jgi:hypothetical protein